MAAAAWVVSELFRQYRTSLISGSPVGRVGLSLASLAATASYAGVNSLQCGLERLWQFFLRLLLAGRGQRRVVSERRKHWRQAWRRRSSADGYHARMRPKQAVHCMTGCAWRWVLVPAVMAGRHQDCMKKKEKTCFFSSIT